MRSLALLLFLGIPLTHLAQGTSLFINDNVDRHLWQEAFDIHDQEKHSAIRSNHRPEFSQDSTANYLQASWNKGRISPLFDLGLDAGFTKGELGYSSNAIIGVYLSQDIGSKIEFDGALYGGITDGLSSYRIAPVTDDVYPGLGEFSEHAGGTGQLMNGAFSFRFTPSDIFTLEVGKAKHFFGSGYRSLFLSDNAAPYPYLKLNTKVWHIDYVNLYSWQQGMLDAHAPGAEFEDKFTSTHMLSWNASPRLNVQVFETIIWQARDSLSNRGFDVHYLNPIIFYRPVEFAAGSADNAIIGFGLTYKVYPSYEIYTQLAFDEFLLDQFRARDGWWGNKYGVQFGIKGYDAFNVKNLYFQAEAIAVRPFTYSHGSPVQNYAHLNEALAHPLGSNFFEANVIGAYEWKDWELRNHLNFILKGDDEDGRNLGGDIFRSYVGPDRDLGNYIGQGARTETFQNSVYLSKILHRSSDARFTLGYHFRADQGAVDLSGHILSFGFKTNFGDGYR